MRTTAVLVVLAALSLGCHPRPISRPSAGEFRPTGLVAARAIRSSGGAEAIFDARNVVSPRLDLTLGPDGSWSGTVDGRPTVLQVERDRITGPGVDLRFDRSRDALRLEGRIGGRTVRATLSDRGLSGYSYGGGCGFDFLPLGADTYRGAYQCPPSALRFPNRSAEVRLGGEAASLDPPLPQTALALVSVLPPY